jgi:hypothetical protein
MTFRPGSRLDPTQVRDRRGAGAGLLVGGGGIGLLALLAYVLLGGSISDLPAQLQAPPAGTVSGSATECRTGAQANEREDCQVVGYVNSIQAFWIDSFGSTGQAYRKAETVLFDGAVSTACGTASSSVGPFYCPFDETVYLDLGFFDELRSRFGVQAGSFARGYVIAHEYGHHVQNILGVLELEGSGSGPESTAVRIELQADCLSGVWAENAAATGFLEPPTEAQVADALNAASAVGDDRIQEQVYGEVRPETWTHGSADQRRQWFLTGFRSGDSNACDTFAAAP